ncbi:acyl-CoA synthetase (AMP-forming)/AMP-acid ligase II [Aeromicrobium sp. SORGH_AS981]|uniref:long-chain-fatty-acid--CoA ligase n=1 Tax=Aeromicrobium sp. SORGH_AS_0981 TaxID=3041802 RepID=UPI0028640287|nr:long-chain-fatty-acid--CoA ligase [Aeromicrobium sp. SORGH_AS_0981]MDR6118399.1 acyl-CoA synthetase (AMP-forming)/AMP-acid ligase II [Aeromicrobium sp. SORGH_AS_0981]
MPDLPDATYLSDFHQHRAEHEPDGRCWTYLDRTWTWSQAWDDVRRLAGALQAEGITRGDRIAFLDKNNPAILMATQASCLLGSANAIVNWRLAGDELDYVINDAGARILFVGHELAPTIDLIRDRLVGVERVVVVGGEHDELDAFLASAEPVDRQPGVEPSDVCLVMYSSGTTGRPKGVMLTQHNMVEHTRHAKGDVEYGPDDTMLVAMPMFHVGGSSYALFGPATGTHGYIIREVDPTLLAGAMAAGVTHAFLVPAVVAGLLQAGPQAMQLFSRLKVFSYGAAPMPLPVLRGALEHWPTTRFMQVYGMTEMGGVVTILDDAAHRDEAHPERLVSAGRPIPGVELRVVDVATLRDVEPGQAGELWWRTEQSTVGYLGRPDATAELLQDGGWLRSGDVGRVDDGGFVFIEDRVKDMIITGGENVYSPEVERVLAEHPAVLETAVIGVPDDTWGESVKAVVAFRPEHQIDPQELIDYARERLAHYKAPKSVDVVEALPRNPSGKILKRDLRKGYWPQGGRQV